MAQDPYYNRKEVSNSLLGKLQNELNGKGFFDYSAALQFGSVIDAILTEPERIDWLQQKLDGEYFDVNQRQALAMVKSFQEHPIGQMILKNCKMQHVSIKKNVPLEYNGFKFNLDLRCKWDFFSEYFSGDLKTTIAKTQKGFEAQCANMQYYRGRAFYMDLENKEKDLLIAISKVNYKIFLVPIFKGDKNYNIGKEQYLRLAHKYYMIN